MLQPLQHAGPRIACRPPACAAALVTAITWATTTSPPAAAQPSAADLAVEARHEAARNEYEMGHYQLAFAEFAALADLGHCASARIALQMVRHGKRLYPYDFSAQAERLQRWRKPIGCPQPAHAGR